MAGFDEKEAETIASNWVQNLRFRFARMGLNYCSDTKDDEKSDEILIDRGRKGIKDVEERALNDRKALRGKDKVVLTDLACENDRSSSNSLKNCPCLEEDIPSPELIQDALDSTRSDKSQVNLKSLRAKRLNFFQQQSNSVNFDNKQTLESTDVTNASNKSVPPKQARDVFSERVKFVKSKLTTSKAVDADTKCDNQLNQGAISKSGSGAITNDFSKNIAWGGSMLNSVNGSIFDKNLPGISVSSNSHISNSNDSLTTNGLHHNSVKIGTIAGTYSSSRSIGCGNESTKSEPKDAVHVFPIELDDNDDGFDGRVLNNQPDLFLSGVDSDSDSDYTLDDPISRHTSPRIENDLMSEHLRQKNGMVSPLALSVSPPAPQITGALYHEFSWSDEEETSSTVANGNNKESNKARQRPRSLSHPSTARDCESPYSCGCVNDVNVVCSVSSTKQCVDVQISYGRNGGISNGWFKSNKLSSSFEDKLNSNSVNGYFHINPPTKQFERVNAMQNNSACASSPNKSIDYIDEQYFDVCVCPECDEINQGKSNWCAECGSALTSTKPVSSKMLDLHKDAIGDNKPLPIPMKVVPKRTESGKVNDTRSPSKTPVSIPNANTDSRSVQAMKRKPKQNGRRWEKSNLSWSTFKDSHLSKPPSTRSFKNHKSKSRVGKEAADVSRPKSTSYRNIGNRGKTEDGRHSAGSLPKSYKFQEFSKKKKGSSYDNDNLVRRDNNLKIRIPYCS